MVLCNHFRGNLMQVYARIFHMDICFLLIVFLETQTTAMTKATPLALSAWSAAGSCEAIVAAAAGVPLSAVIFNTSRADVNLCTSCYCGFGFCKAISG